MTRPWFYTAMGGVVLFAVAFGFGRTYAVPMAHGGFDVPVVLHVHGIFATAWVLLFMTQRLRSRCSPPSLSWSPHSRD